jgi:hypothetical protein
MPLGGFILAGPSGKPVNLDNMSKRVIVPTLQRCSLKWHGWYSLRRFLGTQVRIYGNSETSARALGNSKAVADRHYIKPEAVLPDVRKAVNDALTGLVQ